MPQITKKLLRKRAEHNEGLLTTLEEISLHQEEIEEINEVRRDASTVFDAVIMTHSIHELPSHSTESHLHLILI